MQVAYTNHIGHSSRDTHSGKSTAISSIADLSATEKHNNHDYSKNDVGRMQSDIDLELKYLNRQYVLNEAGELIEIEGRLDLEARVREIYEKEFGDAVAEYNKKQVEKGRSERQISSYVEKISEDKKQEVAVEGLLQIGSLEDWEGKSKKERQLAVPILLQALQETLNELSGTRHRFVLAGASLHMNEGVPHLHYVGVPVEDTPEAKNGLKRRVHKAAVFTKETLGTGLQDNVRAAIEPMVERTFGWKFEAKRTGRNEDMDKRTLVNQKLQEQIDEKSQALNLLEQRIEAAKASEHEANESASRAKKSAYEAEQKVYVAEYKLNALEQKIEELAYPIQTIQDYRMTADAAAEAVEAAEASEEAIEDLRKAPQVVPRLWRQQVAAEIEKAIERLLWPLKLAKDLVSRLFAFETQTQMPEAMRRSTNLDERIRNAAARAGGDKSKDEKEIQRDS